jgi:clan AA aspartic protease
MIQGYVRDNQPFVVLALLGFDGLIYVEFLIDTGFQGQLGMSMALINRLDASYLQDGLFRTADGSLRRGPIYQAKANWHETLRDVQILTLDSEIPLLGVEMLENSSVYFETFDGGEVIVEELEPTQ